MADTVLVLFIYFRSWFDFMLS